jgi:hypothetical protein
MFDTKFILVVVSVLAFIVGSITYLSLPRDLEKDSSSFYMYGRKEIILRTAMLMMFVGAAGAVFGIAYAMKGQTVAPSFNSTGLLIK